MGRRAKPNKDKAKAKRPLAGKRPKNEGAKVRDLEKRLAEASKREAEALEQQTATADILRVISASPADIQPVFAAVLASAARLCDALDATMFRLDGDVLRLVAHEGPIPSDPVGTPRALTPGTPTARAVLEGRTIEVADLQADVGEYPEGSAFARALNFRTVLCAPILRADGAIGAITIRRAEVRPFTDRQVALLKTFADQAVIAIENVRLFTELQEKNRALTQAHAQVTESLDQQTATAEILRVISSSPTDVQPVFDAIVASAVRLCSGNWGIVFRFDGMRLHLAALHQEVTGDASDTYHRFYPRAATKDKIAGRAVLEGRIVNLSETDLNQFTVTIGRTELGYRSMLLVPMLRDGVAMGALAVSRADPSHFPAKQVALFQTFADQAVIAIENVRLFTELQASNRELTTALDTQTATSEILRVISRSQTDAQPAFDAIVASAVRLLGAYVGTLSRVAGDQIELAALTSADAAGDAVLRASFPQSLQSEGPHARAIRDRAPINIADAQADPRLPELSHANARARGYRSQVAVPLLRHAEPIGTISVTRRDPGGFTDDEIALLKTFADQAVIAIENARLFKELEARNQDLSEALEQQTATSELLKVIGRSTFDLQPVFETLAENAVRLCEAERALVYRFDGHFLRLVVAHNASPELRAFIERHPFAPGRGNAAARAALERRTIHIHDVRTDPEYDYGTVQIDPIRTLLSIPMLRAEELLGAITIYRLEVRPFTDGQIALMETFADQAAIAIENARLLGELQARTQELTRSVGELTALGEVGRALSSTLDLETVLQTIVSRAVQIAGTAGCTIWEYDEAREEFRLRASHYADPDDAAILQGLGRAATIHRGQGVTTRVIDRREAVQIADITTDVTYESPIRRPLIDAGHRALLGVPLLSEDEVIGVLTVTRKVPGEFESEVVRLLSTFATQSALAIQNARLFLEIEDKSRQLEVASQHKSEFLANMSHELRTPLNAIIGFSEVLAEGMFGEINDKQAEYLRDILESGRHLLSLINDILDLSKIEAGRMELEATGFDLPTAIDNALTLVRERAGRRGITLGREIDGGVGQIHADERKVKQVLLNLLSNAIKFTPEGGRIDVRATLTAGTVEVSVADTGVGIAPEDQEAVFEEFRQVGTADKKVEGTGLGLALSRKFVELHGGRIWVKSQVGHGSTFTFTLPMRRESSDR